MNRIGEVIIRNLRIAISECRNDLTISIGCVKTYEGVRCKCSTINSAVQSRVKVVRLGCEVDVEHIHRLSILLRIHEVLSTEDGSIVASDAFLHEVRVIVIVDRKYSAGSHEHILSLVHLCFTICKIRIRTNLINELVILGPVRSCRVLRRILELDLRSPIIYSGCCRLACCSGCLLCCGCRLCSRCCTRRCFCSTAAACYTAGYHRSCQCES